MEMDYNDLTTFAVAFQKLLIDIRRKSFATQTKFSKRAGLTRQSISSIECGKRLVSLKTFCCLAQGLGISPVELMRKFVCFCEEESLARHGKIAGGCKAQDYVVNLRKQRSDQRNV